MSRPQRSTSGFRQSARVLDSRERISLEGVLGATSRAASGKELVVVIALAGGSWIFLGAVVLTLVGVIIGFFTIRGSGVHLHPYRHVHGGAPGSDLPTHDAGGSDRTATIERDVAKRWRSQDRPEHAPPEERAAEREQAQRPKPSKKRSIRPPL